jgi:hypothetical protein
VCSIVRRGLSPTIQSVRIPNATESTSPDDLLYVTKTQRSSSTSLTNKAAQFFSCFPTHNTSSDDHRTLSLACGERVDALIVRNDVGEQQTGHENDHVQHSASSTCACRMQIIGANGRADGPFRGPDMVPKCVSRGLQTGMMVHQNGRETRCYHRLATTG